MSEVHEDRQGWTRELDEILERLGVKQETPEPLTQETMIDDSTETGIYEAAMYDLVMNSAVGDPHLLWNALDNQYARLHERYHGDPSGIRDWQALKEQHCWLPNQISSSLRTGRAVAFQERPTQLQIEIETSEVTYANGKIQSAMNGYVCDDGYVGVVSFEVKLSDMDGGQAPYTRVHALLPDGYTLDIQYLCDASGAPLPADKQGESGGVQYYRHGYTVAPDEAFMVHTRTLFDACGLLSDAQR